MDIVVSLLVFLIVNFAIYYFFKLWNQYDYYKSQSEIFFYYKTFSIEQLEYMFSKLTEEELATTKPKKHYKLKSNIKKAIEFKNGKAFDALEHRKMSLQFAKEFIQSLRNAGRD